VFDYARQNNATGRARAVTLDGRTIELSLDPTNFTGTTPARYGEVLN
jgi:type VI protein secretion system component VasA